MKLALIDLVSRCNNCVLIKISSDFGVTKNPKSASCDTKQTTSKIMSSETEANCYDFAVIGCGLSGLAFADRLLSHKKTLRIALIEADAVIGGRTKSFKSNGGFYIDQGGAWLGSKHTNLLELANRFGVSTIEQYGEGKNVWVRSSGDVLVSDADEEQVYQSLSTEARREILLVEEMLEVLSRDISLEEPWSHPSSHLYDSNRFESYFIVEHGIKTEECKEFMNDLTREIFGCESPQVSFLFFLSWFSFYSLFFFSFLAKFATTLAFWKEKAR